MTDHFVGLYDYPLTNIQSSKNEKRAALIMISMLMLKIIAYLYFMKIGDRRLIWMRTLGCLTCSHSLANLIGYSLARLIFVT
jgi:Ni,Fe-hydrogenase I small subunit